MTRASTGPSADSTSSAGPSSSTGTNASGSPNQASVNSELESSVALWEKPPRMSIFDRNSWSFTGFLFILRRNALRYTIAIMVPSALRYVIDVIVRTDMSVDPIDSFV